MDMVRVHVVGGTQHRGSFQQPFAWRAALAVGRVDARDAQDVRPHAGSAAEVAHGPFGIDTALRPRRARLHRTRFVHSLARAIAIHAAGGAVDKRKWSRAPAQHAQQRDGARIAPPARMAFARRWREMQHARGEAREPRQRDSLVQVAAQRREAERPQRRHAVGGRGQREQPNVPCQPIRDAQAHIPTAHDQQPFTAKTAGERPKRVLV